jgi:putative tryptophan/tyrosine transport system substrate-binding protein
MTMRRRDFIKIIGGAAAAWPLPARAQQSDGRVRRVGVLTGFDETDPEGQARLGLFRQTLADLGWIEGRNLRIDMRRTVADNVRLQHDVHEIVAMAPDVILATSTPAVQALRVATQTIPIVFATLSDPVATGVVSNLVRPEANVTGFMQFEHSMAGKWLSLLKDMTPQLVQVALFFHPETAGAYAPFYLRSAQDVGERLGLKIAPAEVRDAAAIEPVLTGTASPDVGLLVLPGTFNSLHSATITSVAAKHRISAIYPNRSFVVEGGLMSYGTEPRLPYRDGATYVDRILRGAKVSELPVQFATKFELVINLKTARAFGLRVSQQLLFIADEVIE